MSNRTIDEIRDEFGLKYQNMMIEQDGNIEILGASFIASEDRLFGEPNKKYRIAEVDWYDSQERNINKLGELYGKIPVIWKEHAANTKGEINSNYGWMIYNWENGNQYDFCLRELKENPNSRRAIMIYQHPHMHTRYRREGMNDFCCTNAVSYYIKDGSLNCVVQMRSNDAIFGYMNDYYWQNRVQERLAIDLNVYKGKMIWQVQSLHIYPRHMYLIKEFIEERHKNRLNANDDYIL